MGHVLNDEVSRKWIQAVKRYVQKLAGTWYVSGDEDGADGMVQLVNVFANDKTPSRSLANDGLGVLSGTSEYESTAMRQWARPR